MATTTTPPGLGGSDPILKLPTTVNFACGASYALRQQHKALAGTASTSFEYVPWEDPAYRPSAEDYAFAASEGVPPAVPRAGMDQSRALGGIGFARAHGREGPYVDAAFESARAGEDLGDDGTLRAVAARAGLDVARFLAFVAKEGRDWARQAQANAARAGATRTATYLVPGAGGPRAVLGTFPRARLAELLAKGGA